MEVTLMYPYFWDWTYILLIPGLLLGLWAQYKVNLSLIHISEPTRT